MSFSIGNLLNYKNGTDQFYFRELIIEIHKFTPVVKNTINDMENNKLEEYDLDYKEKSNGEKN